MNKVRTASAVVVGSFAVHVAVACTASAIGAPSPLDDGGIVDAAIDALAELATPDAIASDADVPDATTADASAPDAPPPMTTAGTRLRPIYSITTSDDGATNKTFVRWRDTKLDVDCSFDLASDGSVRCVPEAQILPADQPGIGRLYADASCTTPLVAVLPLAPSCAAPKFISDNLGGSGAACPSATKGRTAVWHAVAVGPAVDVYEGGPSSCAKVPPTIVPSSYVLFSATTIVAPSEFQSGAVTTVVE